MSIYRNKVAISLILWRDSRTPKNPNRAFDKNKMIAYYYYYSFENL